MSISNATRLDEDERSRRHVALLDVYRALRTPGDGWMSSISENDAGVITHITSRPREAASLYCFRDRNSWTSLSPTRIAGMNGGHYAEIFYEDVISVVATESGVVVNGETFVVQRPLQNKMVQALEAVLQMVRAAEAKAED